MDRLHKIAIVGARGLNTQTSEARLRWFNWNQLSNISNLSDYDTVVLSLLTMSDKTTIDWKAFHDLFNPCSVRDILEHAGRIIVVGDPRFSVASHSPVKLNFSEPFLAWTGLTFHWDDRGGDSKEEVFENDSDRAMYGVYLDKLQTWEYALNACEPDLESLQEGFPGLVGAAGIECFPKVSKYVANRYGGAIGFDVSIAFCKQNLHYRPVVYEDLLRLEPLVFLPKTNLPEFEALTTILRDACGVAVDIPEPEWVEGLVAPGQGAIDADLQRMRTKFDSLLACYESKRVERTVVRRPLRLLYDMGTTLEEVVRDTLRALGAEVDDPDTPGKEDGWVMIEVDGIARYGVLEVKATRNDQFGEGGLRQLSEWQQRGRETRKRKFKGIFIGNSAVNRPPAERPLGFSSGFTETATLQEIAALKSEDIYLAYELKTRGLLNTEQFWRDLFATEGIFDIGPYRAKLGSATANE